MIPYFNLPPVWYFVGLVVLLALVLIVTSLKVPIAVTLFSGSIISAFIFIPFGKIGNTFLDIVKLPETYAFVGIMWTVIVLESAMRKTGMLQKMAESAGNLFKDKRLATALLPTVIGFMPTVGGAYISAPLVEQTAQGMDYTPARKTFINYWFRHIWESSVPLYPCVIMASVASGFSIGHIVMYQCVLTITGAVTGYFIGFSRTKKVEGGNGSMLPKIIDFFKTTWPILFTVILVIVTSIAIPVPKKWASITTLCAMIVSVAIFVLAKKPSLETTKAILKESVKINYILLVLGSIAFKEILGQEIVRTQLQTFFSGAHISPIIVALILPSIVGLLVGITQASIAIGFSVLISLTGGATYGIFALAFTAGQIGSLFSPVHVCVVLTLEYFKSNLSQLYKWLAIPSAIMLAVGFGLYFLLR
jgi:integral membrane protein (TIGR00529 family)